MIPLKRWLPEILLCYNLEISIWQSTATCARPMWCFTWWLTPVNRTTISHQDILSSSGWGMFSRLLVSMTWRQSPFLCFCPTRWQRRWLWLGAWRGPSWCSSASRASWWRWEAGAGLRSRHSSSCFLMILTRTFSTSWQECCPQYSEFQILSEDHDLSLRAFE